MTNAEVTAFDGVLARIFLALMAVVLASLYLIAGATVQAGAATASPHSSSPTCSQPDGPFSYGSAVVGIATTPDDGGYWIVNNAGQIAACGDAGFYGQVASTNRPVVGIAATPDGNGYYVVASDGGVFTFGDAAFQGSTGALNLNKPIVGIAVDPATGGYWLVASDGGVFAFGAPFYGSTGAIHLNKPVVGISAANGGSGYWIVASDGGIFAFNAPFYGSTGAIRLNKPVVGMATDRATGGYWLVASDGGIFAFSAPFYGSTGSLALNKPIVGMEASPSGGGYRFTAADGGVFTFKSGFDGTPAFATALPDFSSFAGNWYAHGRGIGISSTGAGAYNQPDFVACSTCGTADAPQNTVSFQLNSISGSTATGTITSATDPAGYGSSGTNVVPNAYAPGSTITLSIVPASPGQFLNLTTANGATDQLCDMTADDAGQCGA